MSNSTPLSGLAKRLARHGGSDERVEELSTHLDELEANDRPISLLDVSSVGVLVARSLVSRTVVPLVKTYASILLIGITTWWLAVWIGALEALETSIDQALGLEDFEFIGSNLLVAFAVVAAPLALSALIAAHLYRRLSRKRSQSVS